MGRGEVCLLFLGTGKSNMIRVLLFSICIALLDGLQISNCAAELITATNISRYFRAFPRSPYVCQRAATKGEVGTTSTKRIIPGVTIWTKLNFRKEQKRLRGRIREARRTQRGTELRIANAALQNLFDARVVCASKVMIPTPTPSPTPTETPSPTCPFRSCGKPLVLTHWANYLDVSEEQWQEYLETLQTLREIGFTHAGIAMGYNGIDLSARVRELREGGFKLALHNSAGHIVLNNPAKLDPDNHASNGQNLKYFDTPGFNPFACVSACGSAGSGANCSLKPNRVAHDPGYSGAIWQEELTILQSKLDKSELAPGDVMLFDTELWGGSPDVVDYCYPQTLEQSVGRYSGTLAERHAQYYRNWRERAGDLVARVKSRSKDIFTLFYNENIPEYSGQTWIPAGSGDAHSPRFYFAPNLTLAAQSLAGGDHTGVYLWISFSTTSSTWANPPGSENSVGWITTAWDPKITQKLGLMLKQAGVAGVIIYPGPGHHGLTKEYFFQHARALLLGFSGGIDPGALSEICQDGWDNDGDGEFDEDCP